MKKIKAKIPAKLNLTLDVLGVDNGYHTLKSLVCSISIYDTVTLAKRKDGLVTLKAMGVDPLCPEQENNAYKTAKKLVDDFNLSGIDVTVDKRIPVGGGLGGSSADIVGVLKGAQKLFNADWNLPRLASQFGSDTLYMLNGGYAVMQGRGEVVTPVNAKTKLYFLIVSLNQSVSAKDCYHAFDQAGVITPECTDTALSYLQNGNFNGFANTIKNDLTAPAVHLLPQIDKNLAVLKSVYNGYMTGSGSVTYAVFNNRRTRNKAYKILRHRFGKSLIKAHTV